MRVLEAFHISKSLYEPIADVCPSQGSLNGLQKKGKVCYIECLVTLLRVLRKLWHLPRHFTIGLSSGKL
jgi:hypothetical protein